MDVDLEEEVMLENMIDGNQIGMLEE